MAKKRNAIILLGREYAEKYVVELYHLWIGKQKKNEMTNDMLAIYMGIEDRTKFLEETAEGFAKTLCGYGCPMDIRILNGARLNGNVVVGSHKLEEKLVQQFSDILSGRMDRHWSTASSVEPTSN